MLQLATTNKTDRTASPSARLWAKEVLISEAGRNVYRIQAGAFIK
jgi:hypothetical protein